VVALPHKRDRHVIPSNQLSGFRHRRVARGHRAADPNSQAEVDGGGGHFSIEVTSPTFADKSMLVSHRLVHAYAGTQPPVHDEPDRAEVAFPLPKVVLRISSSSSSLNKLRNLFERLA